MIRSIAGDIVLPDKVLSGGWVEIDDRGCIAEIAEARGRTADIDMTGRLVAAGFIDVHVHGGGGADFMAGTAEAARTAARTHARHGTTGMLATTITAHRADVDRSIGAAIEVADQPGSDEARILGIHLEGPYICAAKRGAQPLAPIRNPDLDELAHWIALSGERIRQITMAPEIDGALEFIRTAASRGVAVSIGHTDANAAQTEAGIAAGASHATHLFNAMRGLLHREPGTVGALLASSAVACELIADGVHLHPTVIKIAVAAKGVDRCLLITDAIEGTDMPDGIYKLGGFDIIVKAGKASFEDGTLAGSVLTMERAFGNVRAFAGITASEASRMASLVPARQIGIDGQKGSIELGKHADFAALDASTGAVECTVREGNVIYRG